MSEFTYTKSYATDFGSSWNQRQFHDEVAADGGITPNLLRVDMNGDVIDIVFDASLSAGEQTTLDGLVSAHSPAAVVGSRCTPLAIPKNIIDNTDYAPIVAFEFPGTTAMPNVTNIKTVSFKSTGGTSYSIRVYDTTNFTQICEATLTNTEEQTNDLGAISNIPATSAIFELQAKVVGTTSAVVKSVSICHD